MLIFQIFFLTCELSMSGLYLIQCFWTWTMFHLRVFSTAIYKKRNSNHYLLLLVIFHDLEMIQFWPVNHICLVYKLKFSLWTCPKFWVIVETFDENISNLRFLFIQKTAELVVVESCPTLHWIMFLIVSRLIYDILSHLNGLIWTWSTTLQLC